MQRRQFLQSLAAVPLLTGAAKPTAQKFDVVVVGAGVFGTWTAYRLLRQGYNVALVDKQGPANSLASSGGESRVTRSGYGDVEVYAQWAFDSLRDWQWLSEQAALPLLHQLGVLWVHNADDAYASASKLSLKKLAIPFQALSAADLRERYPVLAVKENELGLFEPQGGAILARRAVQTLALHCIEQGATFIRGRASAIRAEQFHNQRLTQLQVQRDGQTTQLLAEHFVVCAGPWLDKLCPDAMTNKLFVTRQKVLYFNAGRQLSGSLPVWATLPYYGMPSLEGRGFKVANDTHGQLVDPDRQNRRISAECEAQTRAFLAERFPTLAAAPLVESRVCQYENSANGDFIIDKHPGADNLWLVGGGSGHGFKHGPALGRHVADLVAGNTLHISRFSLANKSTQQQRQVQ